MPEIDNCPICNTTCELEYGVEEGAGAEIEREISYATCKTCKTRWRRRDDPKVFGKMIYEKWACRIPEITLPIPFMGGGLKLRPRWCRWVKVREKSIPVGYEVLPSEDISRPKQIVANETISIKKREFLEYSVKLKRGDTLKGRYTQMLQSTFILWTNKILRNLLETKPSSINVAQRIFGKVQ